MGPLLRASLRSRAAYIAQHTERNPSEFTKKSIKKTKTLHANTEMSPSCRLRIRPSWRGGHWWSSVQGNAPSREQQSPRTRERASFLSFRHETESMPDGHPFSGTRSTRRGIISSRLQDNDNLIHFYWKDRSSGVVEDVRARDHALDVSCRDEFARHRI